MNITLDIVVVNWNSGDQLRHCLNSIAIDCKGVNLVRLVVVDNDSSDGSIDGLPSTGLPLKMITNRENRGFAAACNQGAARSRADYILFLNPDTRLYPNSLSRPLAFMEDSVHTKVGIAGIQLIDENGCVSRSCSRFPTLGRYLSRIVGLDRLLPSHFEGHFMTNWDHGEDREVDQVMGAFFLVRRNLFETLNGFDEQFFVYYEEVDFSLRAKKLGWSSHFLADAQAYHLGGSRVDHAKAEKLHYNLESRILYGYKHFNIFQATILMLATLLIEPLSRLALAMFKLSWDLACNTLRGYGKLWHSMFRIMVASFSRVQR